MENVLGLLLMVKNEAETIAETINSTRGYVTHVVVYDTGSTDNTIEIVKRKKNTMVLIICN